MSTVCCVTRLGVGRDKRTFQIAASTARRGHGAIVVEGERSELDRGSLPFELVTIEGAEPLREPETPAGAAPEAPGASAAERSPLRRLGGLVLRANGWWRNPMLLRRLHREDNELTYAALPDADLYYLTFYWQYPAVARKAREVGAPIVYDANDAYWLWPGYRWYPRLFRADLKRVERGAARESAGFVTVSEGVADLLEERYGRRPAVIRNMHDLRVDEDSGLDIRRAAGLGEDEFAVAIVGNEKPSDAVDEAIEALSLLPERVHLVCLGAGYEEHLPRARELGVENRVHLVPPVAPTEVTSAIRNVDACLVNIRDSEVHRFALPSRLFSAVAAGVPVLHPPLPEVRALATEHGLGPAVDAEDPASVAAGIRELLDDPAGAAACGERVRRAREVLNWEREERVLFELVDGALAR